MTTTNLEAPKHPDWAHSYKEYKELLKLPLGAKIERAHMLIIDTLQHFKNNVVACSWGKDSIVLLHLVRDFCPNVKVVFHNTGVEFPETYQFRDKILSEWKLPNYTETMPIMPVMDCFRKYGYPKPRQMAGQGKQRTPMCCKLAKELPAKRWCKANNIECEFVGLQASESMVRRLSFLREGESFYSKTSKHQIVRPLMIWTDKDVWEYQKLFDIPYNTLYDKLERNGCRPCTAFKKWKEVMAETDPKLYNFICREIGEPNLNCFFMEASVG